MARPSTHDRQDSVARALELFWSQGYHATSLKDIEGALDMRPGSIYAAFDSKQGLFQAAQEAYADSDGAAFRAALAAEDTVIDGLIAYVRGLAAPGRPLRGCYVIRSLLEFSGKDRQSRARSETLLAEVEQRLAPAFRAARDRREIDPAADPARLARRMQSDLIAARVLAERDEGAARLRERGEEIVAWLDGLRQGGPQAG